MKKTVSFSRNAVNIFFHILTKCNLNCSHCYINPEQHGTAILPLDTIKKWLQLFVAKQQEANVIFLGGEPTLHPELSGAVKYARALGCKSITIDTNGYLFHDILDRLTPEDVDFISFSLDGATRQTNDAIRGEGCYDACTKGLKAARQKGFNTSLIYTVSGANIHELEKMPELVREFGIKEFFIQVIGIRGNSAENGSDNRQVSRSLWLETIPKVAEKVAESGINVTYPKVFLDENDPFECGGLVADNYFIFPNGRVYRCPLCEDFPIHANCIENDQLVRMPKLNEADFFPLSIPEGCVMNKMIQPDNLSYLEDGQPEYRIACCLLKERLQKN